MKKIIAVVALVVGFSSAAVAETNNVLLSFPPLPPPFDGMETNVTELMPVALYRVVDSGTNRLIDFVCVGTMYWVDAHTREVIIPGHLIASDEKDHWLQGAYGVRMARPDSHGFVGFLTKVEAANPKKYGNDVAFGTVGTNWTSVTNFVSSHIPLVEGGDNVFLSPAATVFIHGVKTKTLRSYITKREVKILGYAVESSVVYSNAVGGIKGSMVTTAVDVNPYIAVEMNSDFGFCGSAFIDEHDRMFIIHAGVPEADSKMDSIRKSLGDAKVKGVCLLTGPIILGRR